MVKKTDTQVEKKTRANGKNQKPIRKSEKVQAKKNQPASKKKAAKAQDRGAAQSEGSKVSNTASEISKKVPSVDPIPDPKIVETTLKEGSQPDRP